MGDVVEAHRRAFDGFTRAVAAAEGRWGSPTPCTEWDARALLEHVIGFHDVLLLRPLDAKPTRPKDDPAARWAITVDAVLCALAPPGVVDAERSSLVGVLTTDVLVHTWDLSRAVGTDVRLDPELCAVGLERARANVGRLAASGMFGAPVPVDDASPVEAKLLAIFGRDPEWAPPS